MSETSATFKRNILVSLLTAPPPEGSSFDPVQAKKDAQALARGRIGKWGSRREQNLMRSSAQQPCRTLRAVIRRVREPHCQTLEDSLKSEMLGRPAQSDAELCIRCVQNKPAYFCQGAAEVHEGLGSTKNGDCPSKRATNVEAVYRPIRARCRPGNWTREPERLGTPEPRSPFEAKAPEGIVSLSTRRCKDRRRRWQSGWAAALKSCKHGLCQCVGNMGDWWSCMR
uniref:Uncharacterized protein n=1 Tax=Macrostomum lignano TaxID=282301 RepID=A0A1I8FH05_9PLAT